MNTPEKMQQFGNTRAIAWLLLIVFCSGLFIPTTQLYAGPGGPSQPEVQGFTPIGVSDMVDPFTGDFTYNIPLMDVEGYPINIAYNSGISMDQEASWVGLGWNINMGTVVRSMRGMPDDFDGDQVTKTVSQKPNTTIGLNFGLGVELFGKDADNLVGDNGGSFSASLSTTYNNYNGFGSTFSFGPSFDFMKSAENHATAGFQFSGSSENGASFSPSLSYSNKEQSTNKKDLTRTTTIGSSLNSRSGLGYISYDSSLKKQARKAIIGTASTIEGEKRASGGGGGSYDLGLHSYSPTSGPSMLSFSLSGNWKLATTIFAVDGSVDIGVSYSRQWIPDYLKTFSNPAYGYFNLQNGQKDELALLDFNRDNDGSFTKYTASLPSAFLTYDVFSVQAQGAGGSFRGFRNEVGYVFDPKTSTISTSGGVGIETGFGNATDIGVDATFNVMYSASGVWDGGQNRVKNEIKFENAPRNLEEFAMQEANERSVDGDRLFQQQFNGSAPVLFPLKGSALNPYLKKAVSNIYQGSGIDLNDNQRDSRIRRNKVMSFLTVAEVEQGMGINNQNPSLHGGAKPYHIGEITQLGTDGRRYIFGIPAYNHYQEDVSFSIGKSLGQGFDRIIPDDAYNGIVDYSSGIPSGLASENNKYGIDNYYSSTSMPSYAHAFMLTAVLSDDYIDSDNSKGPSDDDLGSYVKFDYTKVDNYEWRTPIGENEGYYNEGLKTDLTDDKASFIHGKKDLWYVKAVETKNYIAIFTLEDRDDAGSANGRHGGVNDDIAMKLLRKISLFAKPDYEQNGLNATPLQEVHFEYDYSLCPLYPGNATGGGKLTLNEIFFTYQGSFKMKRSSYTFEYPNNPSYNLKATDRWGNYMPTASGSDISLSSPMNNADYPYTNQDKAATDINVAAWSLVNINLPSGGRIHIDYESDDYAFVQHLPAQRMFKIIGVEDQTASSSPENTNVSDNNNKNKAIYFELNNPTDDPATYIKVGKQLYFRCLVDFRPSEDSNSGSKYEYVSGYGEVVSIETAMFGGQIVGKIKLKGESLKDSGPNAHGYSPITKSALQFGRLHLSRFIFDGSTPSAGNADDSEQGILDFANSVASSITSLGELFTGPNLALYKDGTSNGVGVRIVTQKSFIRLNDPTGKKLGGGIRVKRISMSDNWDSMIGGDESYRYEYGQELKYSYENGTSSGVASYEPQIGGDENPWHEPIVVDDKKRLAPDDKLYVESPLMESQFPSPSVGYAYVEIRDLKRSGVTRTATGKVIKQFFTARDYPTVALQSDHEIKTKNSFLPLLPKYQFLTASQGFSIELNDMHGRPKSEAVYANNKTEPISLVEYHYLDEPIVLNGIQARKLKNEVTVVNQDGAVSQETIGVKYEGVADFRESKTISLGGSVDFNTNSFLLGIIPVIIPMVWPKIDASENRFRSATMNKVINRFGIMDKMTANQDGSRVETNNLAYDAETGEVLTTQTTTNFNDQVFSMNYPAFWKYDQMGLAYQNIGYSLNVNLNSSGTAIIPSSSSNLFVEGDEVVVRTPTSAIFIKGWISRVSTNEITVIDKSGSPISGVNATVKVLRSGRKNKQMTSMASLTALENPLTGLNSNQYVKVLNAGAVEFVDNWQTYCDCFETESTYTTNPYVLGTKGNWRPVKSFTHLSGRSQSNFDNNTNIRKDGIFTSYTPYYKLVNKDWQVNGLNWTYVSEVTAFSPNGMTLETRDALGRYSASLFGFNNTLTTAVAANTRLRQLEFSSFEDQQYSNCMDQNLFATALINPITTPNVNNDLNKMVAVIPNVTNETAHSGRNSLKVNVSTPLLFSNEQVYCAPEPSCKLAINRLTNNSYQIVQGATPYQLESDIISGTGDVILNSDGTISVVYDNTKQFEATLTVTDSKGCKVIYKVTTRATPPPRMLDFVSVFPF